LDCNILNNYKPVPNLAFLSNVIERAVAFHLNKYLISNNPNESLQSAYKSGHSIETALVAVKNDIMMSNDQGEAVILVLLDLYAAFDTVDLNLLFSGFKDMSSLSSKVLEWFQSYLYSRPLGMTAQRCWVKYHLYANDTQLYISLDPDNELNISSFLKNLELCIADIRLWLTQNLLKLNDYKLYN